MIKSRQLACPSSCYFLSSLGHWGNRLREVKGCTQLCIAWRWQGRTLVTTPKTVFNSELLFFRCRVYLNTCSCNAGLEISCNAQNTRPESRGISPMSTVTSAEVRTADERYSKCFLRPTNPDFCIKTNTYGLSSLKSPILLRTFGGSQWAKENHVKSVSSFYKEGLSN